MILHKGGIFFEQKLYVYVLVTMYKMPKMAYYTIYVSMLSESLTIPYVVTVSVNQPCNYTYVYTFYVRVECTLAGLTCNRTPVGQKYTQ